MHNENQVSLSVANQLPDFIREEYPKFEKFLSAYYGSVERGGGSVGILNNLDSYFNLSKYDLKKLAGRTRILGDITSTTKNIQVESTDPLPDENGTVLIDDEVIYYESVRKSPNVVLTPDISYAEFKQKEITLANPYAQFNGTQFEFDLKANNEPVFPPSPHHLIVKVYNEFLRPGIDFVVLGSKIRFVTNGVTPAPPRAFNPILFGDNSSDISIKFLKGFLESEITPFDTIAPVNLALDPERFDFPLKINNVAFEPSSTSLVVAIVDNQLLKPNVDYSIYRSTILFKTCPLESVYVAFINASLLSVGKNAKGFTVVNDAGQVEKILVSSGGSGYKIDNSPKVSLVKGSGINATAKVLVDGLKSISLLDPGKGYSKQNPPALHIQTPTTEAGILARGSVTVNDAGNVETVSIDYSGAGYDFVPRLQFINPSGAKVGNVNVSSQGRILSVSVLSGGTGYTTAPRIYIDAPVDPNGIQAVLVGNLGTGENKDKLVSITVAAQGTGYSQSNLPRVAVVEPTGAQILDVEVDLSGRVINIDLLSGGFGYEDVPSVYIVDDRLDGAGNPAGGIGAAAVATIFNGEIIDINITNFGEGYSIQSPPRVFIADPPGAKASCSVGEGEITGFEIIEPGKDYTKSELVGCSRGVSGIVAYDANENAEFRSESESIAANHTDKSFVVGLDALFFRKVLDRLTKQYLPGLPKLDPEIVNIPNTLRTVKDFYASKGTVQAISYLFKILYGVQIDISYPKDQIIKPSAARWEVDTILRAKLISGNPEYLKDTSIIQEADAVDFNVKAASANVENFIAIQTASYDVYELILSEESIVGKFVVPYATKLAEPVNSETSIITVDSTIGWPERNGEIVIGTELVRYKEKSLTQFIECTRGLNQNPQSWDSATEITSNFYIKANPNTSNEVVMSVLGIVESNETRLTDESSYYLPGDKLTISKLGSLDDTSLVNSWLYNVKKLIEVTSITAGGINNQTATVVCSNPHGLLVGDQVTVYGANPIVYNGSFLVTARESGLIFKYELPQPATSSPVGNILISVDLNKGKSDTPSINSAITNFATNVQNSFFNEKYVYVASSGIPNYKVGPFLGTSLLPGNQRKLYRFPRIPETISLKPFTYYGSVGSFVNGVSAWNYKSNKTYPYGPITKVKVIKSGSDYDADSPPALSFVGGGGTEASGKVVVNGEITEIEVVTEGTGYDTSPLVSIAGGGGTGASATAIVTNGKITKILMNSKGTGYTSAPVVTITGGNGSGCTAVARSRGPIKEVVITNFGKDYTQVPTVTLSSGNGAAAQAYVSNGRIISIAVISSGSGYTTAPNVIISGEGFGAVAVANIQTEGTEAGKVTSITILNKGIGYKTGTTQVRLESIGSGAEFQTEIFQWTFNLQETTQFDYANGSIFEGFNKQFGGEYAHVSNPKQLRFVLGDNLTVIDGVVVEKTSGIVHSGIIGWAFDGNPIYGPYGLSDPTNLASTVVPIKSSYDLKTNLVFEATTNPTPERIAGPPLEEYPAGHFIEDYQYNFRSEQFFLDEYNGRFCKTPDFPEGTYAYFITLTAAGAPAFPYIVGPQYYSTPDPWNLSQFATQAYIPSGVVRFRAPFENVDIDVERAPNESTNALTLENGDVLTFEVEDENKDGLISQDEIDDPNVIFEESRLELFDYFPKIDVSSRVDIEVDTITKFEDAKISGFLVENSGQNHQVGDRLIFDDTGTGGSGASATISEIKGVGVTSYTYEYSSSQDEYFGVIQTDVPHDMLQGDIVNVTTTPSMEPTSKTISVRTIQGLEKVTIDTTGIGYDPEIPIDVVIDSDTGIGAKVEAIVSRTGTLDEVKIKNSGRDYTSNPAIRISHPQIQKRATYYALKKSYGNEVRFLNAITDTAKNTYLVGSSQSTNGDIHGLISKVNSEGVTLWTKSLTSAQPPSGKKCELLAVVKNGTAVYVMGQTNPNQSSASNFNPDIFVAKYIENASGTSATLSWQREIAGISGVLRNDFATDIAMYGDNLVICGHTTTNATGVSDATLIYMSPQGDVLGKRKVTSTSGTEKFLSVEVDSDNNIYAAGVGPGNTLIIVKLQIINSKFVTLWQKQYTDGTKTFDSVNILLDEYDQVYVTSTLTSGLTDRLSVIKVDKSGTLLLQKEYNISSHPDITSAISSIDVFGDLNLGFTSTDTLGKKSAGIVKLDYKGNLKNAYIIAGLDGYILNKVITDVSGDPIFIGESKENSVKFFYQGSSAADTTGQVGNLTLSSADASTVQYKWTPAAYAINQNGTITTPTLNVTSNTWTVEGWFKLQSSISSNKVPKLLTITDANSSQEVEVALFADSTSPSTNGKLRISNLNATTSTLTTLSTYTTILTADFAHIAVTKSFVGGTSPIGTYTLYVNGSSVASFQMTTNVNPTSIVIGNAAPYYSHPLYVDSFRYSNTNIVYTSVPTADFSAYEYSKSKGQLLKFDRNADADRVGNINLTNNTDFTRTLISNSNFTSSNLTVVNETYPLGAEGFQILDYTDTVSFLTQDFHIPTDTFDQWSSRTATVPSPGGRKAVFSTKAFGKFFFRSFQIEKFDNVRSFVLNQESTFESGDTLIQKNSLGATIATGRIVGVNTASNELFVTDVTGSFAIDSGTLENSNQPPRINDIEEYSFADLAATTPGTFTASIPGSVEATFKTYSDDDYLIRIDEVITGSTFARGSVVTLTSSNYSFNTARTTVTITGLTAVTKITLITNLKRTMQIDSIGNTNRIFARSSTSHYLNVGDNIYTETSPVYSTVDGSFFIEEIISKKEFIFTIDITPSAFVGAGTILLVFVKHPIFKFIYGQQYTFDLAHPSNLNYFLSFYRDNLTKIEYTFKNIVRKGRPGIDAPGASPFISFKITDDVANISYYADPSRIGDESPVSSLSYIDVVKSPYIGKFEITSISGGTITTGANKFKFKLSFDPEKQALANVTSYSTQSSKVAGAIANIRLVNGGGFYKKLPVIVDIESIRKIERVDITSAGTEYEPGEYFGVPIAGDGAGGKVRITVAEGSDPAGQITEVVVTDPGKGYTTGFIDVDAIDGILGSDLGGSGAVLDVVIPPRGTGSSIFVKGENIGKIKRLKNNNFGFNYTHDYTLRPEITFPINLQLINTSILSNIKVTNPGTGYTSVPAVIITGGGGQGAEAIAEVRNGRISAIIIKNAGFGYSTPPDIALKTSFNYVVNLDLALFQVPYPHGIQNGAEITFAVENLGEGEIFPLTSFGFLVSTQTYYAVSGIANGLEPNQLRVALTPQDAASGNYISFVNTGVGRQIVQTDSFGGSAEAVVETSRFLSGELVFQGESLETATATGFVSNNDGWQIGPRILKLINTEGVFKEDQVVSGVISKSSGTIENINAAKGVIEVDSITKTPGRFLDDIGKPNEIVQKIQDSYLYQSFSYNVKSPISIDKWKNIIVENTHPTGFKVFGEIEITEQQKGLSSKTDFELTKSVNLIESSVVSNIDNFGIVEPIYEEFDNTQVLFRTKSLTSSEEILTSYVQKIDSIAHLFDGERTVFPLTINGATAIATTSQLQLVINGVAQNPGTSFNVQQGSIVFNEPPPAPTKISYAKLTLQFLQSKTVAISDVSGILPELGQTIRGLTTNVTATVISSTTNSITFFNPSGDFQTGELILCAATGLSATSGTITTLVNDNIFEFRESITNMSGKTADVEEINLNVQNSVVTNTISVSKTSGTYTSPTGLLKININDFIISAKTRVVAKVIGISPYIDPVTQTPISSITISDPSTFFGTLYNRIISPEYPNVIIDDISKSSIEVVDLEDSELKVEGNIPEFEIINTTTFESEIRTAKEILASGNAASSLAQSKFGGGSVYLDGTGDYLTITNSTDFDFGNYTLESWIYVPSLPSGDYAMLFGLDGVNWYWGIRKIGSTLYLTHYDGTVLEQSTGTTLTTGTWAHVAWSRSGSTLKAFLNGTQVFSGTSSASANATGLKVGYQAFYVDQYQFNGYLDEIRVSNVARYTTAFIPAQVPFTNDIYTKLLIHGNTNITDDGGSEQALVEDEFIQNLKIEYTNSYGENSNDYALGETIEVRKLSVKQITGGNFQTGDVIATTGNAFTANVIGVNYAFKVLYLGNQTGTYTIGQTVSCEKTFVTNDDIVDDRFADATNLILANKLLIADVAVGRMLANFPGFTVPGGSQNCKDDIYDVLEEMCFNLKYGGNHKIYDVGLMYINNPYLLNERDESVYAFNQVRDMAIQAMRNETITIGGHSTLTQVKDTSVEGDQSGVPGSYTPGDCANVASAITSLFAILSQAIGTDATPGNLTGVTRTNIGLVSAKISANLTIPFIVEDVDQSEDLITSYQLYDDTQSRFRDASNLIRLNITYIIEESLGRMKSRYPDLVIPGDEDGSSNGTNRCKLDLTLLISAIVEDLEFGGNLNTLTAARLYLDGNGGIRFIPLQLLQSCYLHEETNLLCQDAAIGDLSETPVHTNQIPLNPLGITVDTTPGGPCANVLSQIDTLWQLVNDVISTTGDVYKDAGDLLWFNRTFIADEAVGLTTEYFTYTLNGVTYSAFDYPGGATGISKCKRDLKEFIIPAIIGDLVSGGNANIIDIMSKYLDTDLEVLHVKEELLPTIYAIEQTKRLCQYAVDNWIITGTQDTEYQPQFANPALKYKDTTITIDNGEYGGHCADVKSAIEVLFTLGIGILLPEREQYIVSGRFLDAGDLIDANALLIADVAVGRMLANFPGFTVPGGGQNCKDDVLDILNALTYNLRNGGNQQIYDAAGLYLNAVLGGGSHVSGEETQSIYVLNQARDLAIQAMRNETITIGGHSTRTQFKDLTITVASDNCAQVASSITTLMAIVVQAIQNGNLTGITRTTDSPTNVAYRNAAKLIMFNKNYFKEEIIKDIEGQYGTSFQFGAPSGSTPSVVQSYRTKCKRDIGYVIDSIIYDLLTYGNSSILETTKTYIDAATGTILSLQGELAQAIFGYERLKVYLKQAIAETLVSPSPGAVFYAHTDPTFALTSAELTQLNAFIDSEMAILLGTLNNATYLETNQINPYSSVTVPNKIYPDRIDDPGITGRLITGDYIYGLSSGVTGEIKSLTTNRGTVKKILTRVRVNFDLPNEVFAVNEEIVKQGAVTNKGIVYSYSYSETATFVDIDFISGSFVAGDILINDEGYLATVVSVVPKVQISDLVGSFESGDKIKGFTSSAQIVLDNYSSISAPVLDNSGSKLTLETEAYFGNFKVSEVVYAGTSNIFIDVDYALGTALGLGDIIQTKKIYKLDITINSPSAVLFPDGYVLRDSAVLTRTATIVDFIPNNVNNPTSGEIYLGNIQGGDFTVGSLVEVYEPGNNFPIGTGSIVSVTETNSEAYGFVEKIVSIGTGQRLFLSRVAGTFNKYAEVLGRGSYKASVLNVKPIVGRVKRSFRGFDGVQDLFKLTVTNGTPYFPNPDGHLLVFVNGILQPPTVSYSAFSDSIQFTEPPELGASFHSVYIGQLRQLDDISFEFDSLRNSFNLRLNEVFYSLTVTAGASSANIKPENNIIVSLNGVIQEPGIGFNLVGSRIIFAEVPRAGSSFVAFSYIGSEADVIAKTVIPPIESGDQLEIEGEDEDRTVAIIESSNSLVTFDYSGSVFGRNASALVSLISGRVINPSVTASGNGFTSRPSVSVDSSTGFDAQIKALVGVSRVDVVNRGSGYAYPSIFVDNDVADVPADLIFSSDITKLDNTELTFDAT